VRQILAAINDAGHKTQTVCIGGVSLTNVEKIFLQTGSPMKNLDGVAVVSAVISAEDPETASRSLLGKIMSVPPIALNKETKPVDPRAILAIAPTIVETVAHTGPLTHNMTNLV
jgi:thiamine-phosphate diphosphorylase / hydroxyethylthiazole kinase